MHTHTHIVVGYLSRCHLCDGLNAMEDYTIEKIQHIRENIIELRIEMSKHWKRAHWWVIEKNDASSNIFLYLFSFINDKLFRNFPYLRVFFQLSFLR
jgi:hypothetical protein